MKNISNQRGAVLAIGLLLLLVLTAISITAMKTSALEEKMAGSLKNLNIAESAAQSLLVEVERYIFNYYVISNGTSLQAGSNFIVKPRSVESYSFKNSRELSNGFSNLNGISMNEKLGNILKEEPQFIIEEITSSSSGRDSSGNVYAQTDAETDNAGSASSANGGGTGDESSTEVKIYRITTKSTDTTGHAMAAFESVMSVQIK